MTCQGYVRVRVRVRIMMRFIKATLPLLLVLVCVITTVVGFLEFRAIRGKVSQANSLPRSISPFADKYERNGFDRMPTVSAAIVFSCS